MLTLHKRGEKFTLEKDLIEPDHHDVKLLFTFYEDRNDIKVLSYGSFQGKYQPQVSMRICGHFCGALPTLRGGCDTCCICYGGEKCPLCQIRRD